MRSERNSRYLNPHTNKPFPVMGCCRLSLVTILAFFCFFCIYRDLTGKSSDPIQIISEFKDSLQNLTMNKVYKISQTVGIEVAQEMADSPTVQHFHQYNLSTIWKQYQTKVVQFIEDNILSIFKSNEIQTPSPQFTTIFEQTVIYQNTGKSIITKTQKSCSREGGQQICKEIHHKQILNQPQKVITNSYTNSIEKDVQSQIEEKIDQQKISNQEIEKTTNEL